VQDISFHSHHEDAMQRNRVSDSNVLMKGKKERGRERTGGLCSPRDILGTAQRETTSTDHRESSFHAGMSAAMGA